MNYSQNRRDWSPTSTFFIFLPDIRTTHKAFTDDYLQLWSQSANKVNWTHSRWEMRCTNFTIHPFHADLFSPIIHACIHAADSHYSIAHLSPVCRHVHATNVLDDHITVGWSVGRSSIWKGERCACWSVERHTLCALITPLNMRCNWQDISPVALHQKRKRQFVQLFYGTPTVLLQLLRYHSSNSLEIYDMRRAYGGGC